MPDPTDLHDEAREERAAAHPDAIERVRVALWCPEPSVAARHVRGCDSCNAEANDLRRARDVLRSSCGAEPSPEALRSVDRALRAACEPKSDVPMEMDFEWLRAEPVAGSALGSFAGVRGMASGGVLRCQDADLRLELLLGPDLSGQVLADGDEPCSGLDVTLFLDRRPAGSVRTDRFGEFSMGLDHARSARSVGVRVAGRGRTRHVEVWRAPESS